MISTTITGDILLGSAALKGTDRPLRAINPDTGATLEPTFAYADASHVSKACELAWTAFQTYRNANLETRAKFLETIAQNILDLGDALVERAMAETGLPRARIEGERGRTVGQLRLFAEVVRSGEWLDLRVDEAMPDRKPLPRSDLRMRQIPLGPVVVFGASNFPLAFSVAGGDTAAAFAAGCPVIVKSHPAHPGTGELVGRAIQAAVQSCGLPEGTFSLLLGNRDMGSKLVQHPHVKAVGFTGSRSGGVALCNMAASRPEPIPVYAEMSSINPVFLLPGALAARAEQLGTAFIGSLTMGSGQFCTNPGLVLALDGPDLERFVKAAGAALSASTPVPMLTPGIYQAFATGVQALVDNPNVNTVARGAACEGPNRGPGALFVTDAASFLKDERLSHEVFGASSVLIRCANIDEMAKIAAHVEGQLTATLHMEASDAELARHLLPVLETKAGRILANGWPTGVEVCNAMVHGGPFPATSDSRTTSVGTLAIRRFLRPVCYQDIPANLLPSELKPETVKSLPHLLNGKRA